MFTAALVGKPNVGKSALFNRLAGRRLAIVDAMAGVTRDRLYTTIEWNNARFQLIDTGGIVSNPDQFEKQIERHVNFALDEADLILFTVDAQEGLSIADEWVADVLRKANKKVWIVANKADNKNIANNYFEFNKLGWDKIFTISATHGLGTSILLDAIAEEAQNYGDEETQIIPRRFALVGKPNAGKSSLLNKLAGYERAIVSEIPGTTRDSFDTIINWKFLDDEYPITIIDTAGIQRNKSIDTPIEKFSMIRTERAIKNSTVALFLIDATQGISMTDKKIAHLISENGTACVIAINKWDLMKGRTDQKAFKEWCYIQMPFLKHVPLMFISATTGEKIKDFINKACFIHNAAHQSIPTGPLNRAINEAVMKHPHRLVGGKSLKVYYSTHTHGAPQRCLIFVNNPDMIDKNYEKYIQKVIREKFKLEGCPVLLEWRRRPRN